MIYEILDSCLTGYAIESYNETEKKWRMESGVCLPVSIITY